MYDFSKQHGFTLIELIVATSIFIVVMLLAMSSLVASSDQAKRSEALRASMDNVNFAMEHMSRNIRIGSDYTCVTSSVSLPAPANNDCPLSSSGGGAFVFTPASGQATPRNTAYQRIVRSDGTYALQRCTTTLGCVDIVAPEVNVEILRFFVTGSDPADTTQPSVYIILKGTILVKQVPTSFSMQTLASQRSSE